jgi:pilus assembly protein Flp/PilA
MLKFVAFVKSESGATAIEYGLIVAGISVAIIAAINGIGSEINNTFTSISDQIK